MSTAREGARAAGGRTHAAARGDGGSAHAAARRVARRAARRGARRNAWPVVTRARSLAKVCGLAAVIGALASGAAVAAQTPAQSLDGRIIDTTGVAIADQAVVLHRVTGDGGGEAVARAVTDAAGHFTLDLPDDAADGLLFAAARADGRLYIGPTFRSASAAPTDYRIVVGGPGLLQQVGAAPAGPRRQGTGGTGTDPRALGWAGVAVALAAGLLLLIGWRVQARPPESRRLLRDLALLEERRATRDSDGDPGAEQEYGRRRAELRARLREIARS